MVNQGLLLLLVGGLCLLFSEEVQGRALTGFQVHGASRHVVKKFVLGKKQRSLQQDSESEEVAALQAAGHMIGMSDEEMWNEMFDETWPPIPPSPPPAQPNAALSLDPYAADDEQAAVAALELSAESSLDQSGDDQYAPDTPPGDANTPPFPPAPDSPATPPPALPGVSDPLKVGDNLLLGTSNIVAVHMVMVPGFDRYLFMERPSGKHPDGSYAIAGFWDLDDSTFTNVNAIDSLFCAGHTITADGNILVVGGHQAKSGYADGLRGLRLFNSSTMTLNSLGRLRAPRWYPTATLLPNRQILIVGGTLKPGSGTGTVSYYELWDPAFPDSTIMRPLSKEFVNNTFDVYYPNNYVLPDGNLFMYCNTYGEIIQPYSGQVLQVVPPLAENTKIQTEYPYTGTSVMLPLLPENNYTVEVVYFGGQFKYGWVNTTASVQAWRLKVTPVADEGLALYDFGPGWVPERMLRPRVMPDATLLPNGQVVIVNGARRGLAGDNVKGGRAKANDPNFWPELYTPWAAHGQRFTPLRRSTIPRLYHSTAALTMDGTVIVSGCDRCGNFWSNDKFMTPSPWNLPEYRVELFRPPVWHDYTMKPFIESTSVPTVAYDTVFTITYYMFNYTLSADRAVLVAPSATTHSTNMHQRVVGMVVLSDSPTDQETRVMVVRSPPNANIAPPGKYMLFLLNGISYGRAVWLDLQ